MDIKIEKTAINGLIVVTPEIFREDKFIEYGLPSHFVQLNHSVSVKGVLRGLHFQWNHFKFKRWV